MMNVMEKVVMERVRLILSETSERYGFNCEEEMLRIGCVIGKKVSKVVTKKVVSLYVYPYVGEEMSSCLSVKYNSGLYSQCLNEREVGDMCVGCVGRAKKHGGVPEYGYINERGSDLEFTSKYGRSVMCYGKLVNKNKWEMRAVMEEAGKYNILLTEEMFNLPVKIVKEKIENEKGRGRPKKESKVVESEDETQDLFRVLQGELRQESILPSQETLNKINEIKMLVEESKTVSNDVELKSNDESSLSSGTSSNKSEKKAMKEALKLEKEAAKVAEKLEKEETEKALKLEKEEAEKALKLEKEAAKVAEKLEKEETEKALKLEKEAAKAAEKLEKEAAKAAEKLEKEAAKEVEKASKELEKMAKAAEKLEKEAAKALEKKVKLEKEAAKAAEKLAKLEKASVKSVVVVVDEKKVEVVVEKADSGYVSASSELSCESNTDDDSEDEVEVKEEEDEEEEDDDNKIEQELVEVVAPVIVNKSVRRFRHKDVDYLMSSDDNILYLASTQDPVGKWNEQTKSIDELDDVESDSDAESDSDEESDDEE